MAGPYFRVLGPIEVRLDGAAVPLRTRRHGALLTALLMHANRVVPPSQLIEAIWGEDLPAGPERALHTSVSRLRSALGDAAGLIRTVAGGYIIDIADDQLDLIQFRTLVEQAGTEEDPVLRTRSLAAALDLWREVPLSQSVAESVLEGRPWLLEERLQATERLIDARLAQGENAALVAELTVLTKANPLRERFWTQWMLALSRSGRQADALAAYRQLAALLAEELGVDPGAEVREVHQAILTGEAPRVAAQEPETDSWSRHWQLPMDLSDFVGRGQTIDDLGNYLGDATAAMPVAIISGPPGVGKSALAVHLGHRLRSQFRDGQWHVRLAGASGSPRDPLDVLAELLGLAGIDPYDMPADVDGRAAMLRSALADRRVLLVLDDARDTRQVTPLLPGTEGNAVLVTSRSELTGLSVAVGARLTRLEMLDLPEATALLGEMLGVDRVAAEPEAAAELSEVCGRLPLALRIAAGLLARRPEMTVAEYSEELASGDRLAGLAIGDEPDTAVAAAFGLSYESLPPPARRMFALLGVAPGNDVSVPAAAALFDRPVREVGVLLETLAGANLLQRERSRYRMHDLIRLYAAGRAAVEPGADEAWLRLADWYLRTTDAAIQFEYKPLIRLTGRQFDDNPFDESQAAAWLEAEEPNLIAAMHRAADTGPHEFAWRLADVLRHYFSLTDRVAPWRHSVAAGLKAAKAAGDNAGVAAMQHSLGVLGSTIGDLEGSIKAHTEASALYAEAGFQLGEAALLCNLGMSYDDAGESAQAAELLLAGIKIFRSLGPSPILVPALHSLSNVYYNLGDLDAAVTTADEAIAFAPEARPRHISLINRGPALRLLGDLVRAEEDLTEAVELVERPSVAGHYELALLYVDLERLDEAEEQTEIALEKSRIDGLEWHEAAALNVLGIVRRSQDRPDEAGRHHEAARDIAVRLGHRATEAEALLGLAAVASARGDLAGATKLGEQARELAAELNQRIIECRALQLLGRDADAERIREETGYRG